VKFARHFLEDKIVYHEDFIPFEEANSLFLRLQAVVPWQQERIRMMGKWVLQPRLTAWYGDADACYTYAGLINRPLPWLPILNDLRKRLEDEIRRPFNSVLLNCYRDGRDYMGWHSDDERSLGPNPVIASLSLGAERRFSFRPKKHNPATQKKDVLQPGQTDVVLQSGSLLLMKEGVQVNYKHALPKALRVHDARINLTYRNIVH
jgi:alkylated DNA repair dioxygenase AlkB